MAIRASGAPFKPRPLSAYTTEKVVEWYLLNGGSPGSWLGFIGVGEKGSKREARDVRITVAGVLAQCPHHFERGQRRITPLEFAVLCELQLEREEATIREMERRGVAIDLAADYRMAASWADKAKRTRAHSYFAPSVAWTGAEFGRIVWGDPEKGLSPDCAFLEFMGLEAA